MIDLVLSSVLFSLSFGLIRAEVKAIDPFVVALLRLLLSLAAFSPWLKKTPHKKDLMAIGFVQYGVMYCFYIASFRHLQGHQVAILTTTTPILVVLIDGCFEAKVSKRALLAAAIAMIAGLVVVFDEKALATHLIGLFYVMI